MTTAKRKPTKSEQRYTVIADATAKAQEAVDALETLYNELEEIRANMEEKFSETERYQAIEAATQSLESALDHLRSGIDEANDTALDW